MNSQIKVIDEQPKKKKTIIIKKKKVAKPVMKAEAEGNQERKQPSL